MLIEPKKPLYTQILPEANSSSLSPAATWQNP